MSRLGRSSWRTRAMPIGAGVVVVAVLVGGGVAYAARGDGADHYRTAAVSLADVDQTLALSGTIDSSGRSDLSFGTAGTIAELDVVVGDKVTKGEVLARLDTASLNTAVTKANAQLAAARAQLARDEDDQASAVSTSTTSGSSGSSDSAGSSASAGSTSSAPAGGSATTPSGSGASKSGGGTAGAATDSAGSAALAKALAQLAQQQKAVEVSQTAVSTAIVAAQDAIKQETTACIATDDDASTPTATDSASAGNTGSADPDGADGGNGSVNASGSGPSQTDACTSAIATVQDAQQKVADAEYAGSGNLKDALATLSNTLADAANAADVNGSTAGAGTGSKSSSKGSTVQQKQPQQNDTGSATQGSGTRSSSQSATSSSPSSPTSFNGGSGSSGQTVTAATLAKDQASIDEAKATLIRARQALGGATIKAPAKGTVGQVSVTRGDSISAGNAAIVVLAPGTTTVGLNVSSAQVAELKVGQKAQVTPAGAARPYAGTVTRVSQVPTSSSTGSSTYPVTVTLDQRGLSLLSGAAGSVDITLGSAANKLTVPTSAVSNGSVEVYADGKVSRVRVTTGLVGRTRTVITDGLEAGQRVVLADMSTDLPTSGSDTTTRTGRSGAFGSGSFSGGGFSVGSFGGRG